MEGSLSSWTDWQLSRPLRASTCEHCDWPERLRGCESRQVRLLHLSTSARSSATSSRPDARSVGSPSQQMEEGRKLGLSEILAEAEAVAYPTSEVSGLRPTDAHPA